MKLSLDSCTLVRCCRSTKRSSLVKQVEEKKTWWLIVVKGFCIFACAFVWKIPQIVFTHLYVCMLSHRCRLQWEANRKQSKKKNWKCNFNSGFLKSVKSRQKSERTCAENKGKQAQWKWSRREYAKSFKEVSFSLFIFLFTWASGFII